MGAFSVSQYYNSLMGGTYIHTKFVVAWIMLKLAGFTETYLTAPILAIRLILKIKLIQQPPTNI